MKTKLNTDNVCASAWRMLGAIKRAFYKLTPTSFQLLFNSHVRPKIGICWFGSLSLQYGRNESIRESNVQQRNLWTVWNTSPMKTGWMPSIFSNNHIEDWEVTWYVTGEYYLVSSVANCKSFSHYVTEIIAAVITLPSRSRGRIVFTLFFWLSGRVVNNWNALAVSVVEEKSETLFKRKLDQHLERMWHRDRLWT